jgi:hypothetical protein
MDGTSEDPELKPTASQTPQHTLQQIKPGKRDLNQNPVEMQLHNYYNYYNYYNFYPLSIARNRDKDSLISVLITAYFNMSAVSQTVQKLNQNIRSGIHSQWIRLRLELM